jgi:hypothetical protein
MAAFVLLSFKSADASNIFSGLSNNFKYGNTLLDLRIYKILKWLFLVFKKLLGVPVSFVRKAGTVLCFLAFCFLPNCKAVAVISLKNVFSFVEC